MTENDKHNMEAAALVFLKDLLSLKNGQRILFYTDRGSDPNIARILHASAKAIGAKSEVFELDSTLALLNMAQNLTEKIEKESHDVICELSEQYFYQTAAWQRALQLGARLYSIGGLRADGFICCVGKAHHALIYEFGMGLKKILEKAKSVQITTKKGTDIRLEMNISIVDRIIAKLTGKKRPYAYVTRPSGKLAHNVPATFLGGQIAFNGIPETIEGTAVIDGYIWPPQEIGHIDKPISLKIKKGRVTDVNGDSPKSRILSEWFNGKTNEIKHFCVGFHPGARLSGTLIEAERAFGYISIGIGEYPFHTDGVITNPTLLLNNEIIEKDGSFIHKDLAVLENRLLQFLKTD
jgi:leucyl aminopeptidase (aminopeptidase T)